MYSLKFQSYHAKAVPASPPHTFGSYWLGGRVRLVVGGEIVFNNKNNVAVGHHNFLPVLILVEVGFKFLNDNFCFHVDISFLRNLLGAFTLLSGFGIAPPFLHTVSGSFDFWKF